MSVQEKINELESFNSSDVPSLLCQYYLVCDRTTSLPELYLDFKKKLNDDSIVPTISSFMFIFNLFDTDKHLNRLMGSVELNLAKIKEAESTGDIETLRQHTRILSSLESQIFSDRSLILKFSDNSLNRETPRKVEIERKTTSNDVLRLMQSAQMKRVGTNKE